MITIPNKEKLLNNMRNGAYYKETMVILHDIIKALEKNTCSGVDSLYLLEIINALSNNPHYKGNKEQLDFLVIQSRLYQLQNKDKQAIEVLEKALTMSSRPDIMSALAEKYIYLNNLKKAYPLIIEMEEYCTKHSIKCANSIKNIPLLKQLYHSVLISGSDSPQKKNNDE